MRHLLRFVAVISVTLFVFNWTATAAEIRMGSYAYNYGKTSTALTDREIFVISEYGLTHPRLALKPKVASLAVRTSEVRVTPDAKPTMETRAKNNSAAEQTDSADTDTQPSIDHMCLLPIYFRFDRADLSDFETDQLDRLVSWVDRNSSKESLKVQVTGYTCDLGSRDHNERLSLLRAKSVAAYLEIKGLKPVEVRGEGKNKPLSEVRRLNRRVEIKIVR